MRKTLTPARTRWTLAMAVLWAWTTAVLALPPTPSGLSATSGNGQVSLQWTSDLSPTPTVLYYGVSRLLQESQTPTGVPSPTSTPVTVATIPIASMPTPGTPVFQDLQVTNGRSYLYQVWAVDPTGTGPSAPVTVSPFLAPAAVDPVTVQAFHTDALDLSWGIPSSSFPVSYYQVFRAVTLTCTATIPPTATATPTASPTGTLTSVPTSTATASFTRTPTFPPAAVPMATITWVATPWATVFTNTYSDTGADPTSALAYYYYVLAVDSAGNNGNFPVQSTKANNAIHHGPPASLSLVAQSAPGTYGMDLFWAASLSTEQVSSYQVLRNGSSIGTVPYVVGTPTVTFRDTNAPGTGLGIVYQVKASNPYGTSSSNPVTQTLFQSVQGSIQVTPDALHNSVTISWNPGTAGSYGLGGYRIYKGLFGPSTLTPTPSPFFTAYFSPTVSYTITPVVDAGIVNHMGYWVEPVDATGHGGKIGTAASVYLNLAPTPSANLTVAVATPAGNNRFTLNWTAGNNGFYGVPDHYVLYRSVYSNASPTPTPMAVATAPYASTGTTDVVSGFAAGSTVRYSLALADGLGNESDLRGASNVVTLSGTSAIPAPPALLPFTGSDTAIEYAWLLNPLSDAVTAYQVHGADWATPGPATPTPVWVVSSPVSVMTYEPSPTPWVPNTYYLVAQNAVGDSTPTLMTGIPVPAYQVSAVVPPGSRSVSLDWSSLAPTTQAANYDSYHIYRAPATTPTYMPVAVVPATTRIYTDVPPVATAGVSYRYQVVARSGTLAESPLYPRLTPDTAGTVQLWPNAPTAVTVLSGAGSTTLAWAPNGASENVQSYTIYRNGTATVTVTPSPTFSIPFIETAGNLSVYEVEARNASGPGDLSNPVSVLVPPAVTPVIALTPVLTGTPGVGISGLTYSGAVSGYTIYRQSVATPSVDQVIGTVAAPASSFGDTSPQTGYVGNYKVVANNGLGLQTDPAVSAQLGVSLWPNPPSFSLDGSAATIVVAWATPVGNAPVTGFGLYRSLYPATTPTPLVQSTPPAASYSDTGVTVGNSYIYWMDAQNASGSSTLSAPQTMVAVDGPSLSLTPLPQRNQLVWSVVAVPTGSPVTGYTVLRAVPTPGTTPNFLTVASMVGPLSNTAYADTQVADGVTYVYKVAASTLNGIRGAFSNAVTQYVQPLPVTNLLAISSDRLVQLRWGYQGTSSNTYVVQKKLGTAPDTDFRTIKSGIPGTDFTDTDVIDKNFYVYRVLTVDGNGVTAAGSAMAIGLPAKSPLVPNTAVSLTQNTSNTQTVIGNSLAWQSADPNGIDPTTMYPLGGYNLLRSSDGGGIYQTVATLPAVFVNGTPASPVTYFDQVDLLGGAAYTYLVQAFDAPPDLPVALSQAATQGLVHTTSYDPVTAYPITPDTALDRNAIRPNGAANEQSVNIRFVITTEGHVNIKVYSLGGTFVKELVNDNYSPGIYWTSWDAHNRNDALVASGVYLITTESPGGHQQFSKVAVIK